MLQILCVLLLVQAELFFKQILLKISSVRHLFYHKKVKLLPIYAAQCTLEDKESECLNQTDCVAFNYEAGATQLFFNTVNTSCITAFNLF